MLKFFEYMCSILCGIVLGIAFYVVYADVTPKIAKAIDEIVKPCHCGNLKGCACPPAHPCRCHERGDVK